MHKKSRSDFEIKHKRVQQAELVKSGYPKVKQNLHASSSWNKKLTIQASRYPNQQAGGFSYDDFYDSLKELNSQQHDNSVGH